MMLVNAMMIGRPLFCAAVWPTTRQALTCLHTLHTRIDLAATKTVPDLTVIIPTYKKTELRAEPSTLNSWSKHYSTAAMPRTAMVRKDTNEQGIIDRVSQRFMSSIRKTRSSTVTKNIEDNSLSSHDASKNVETGSPTVGANVKDSIETSQKAINTTKALGSNRENSGEEETDEVDLRALVELEVELSRQDGHLVPSTISPSQWQELLSLKSFWARKKYLTFLFKNEQTKINYKKKKEERRIVGEKVKQEKIQREAENDHINYGLKNNTMFMRILDANIAKFYNGRVMQEIRYGVPLVLDMSYDEYMKTIECRNCAKQLMMLITDNRQHEEPFHLHLCNAELQGHTIQHLQKIMPPVLQVEYPVTVSSKSYLDVYPRDKLIYLSPHCKEEMVTYDRDAIYIMGGIVDKSNTEPLSLAKGKREGIRMQKLPLDRYLDWGKSSRKTLALNQVVNILLDFRVTGDWEYALRHVPRRKMHGFMGNRQREEKLRRRLSFSKNRKFEWFD